MKLQDYLKQHRIILDGSMGTYYLSLVDQPGALSENANRTSPEIIEGIHRAYLEAGARVIRTNTFAANRATLRMDAEELRGLVEAACRIAKKAAADFISEAKGQDEVWILGNIGPIPEDAESEEEAILEEYKELCDSLLNQGLDGIHFETFFNTKYIEKLVPYIRSKHKEVFILASFSLNRNGYTGAGISANRLMEKVGRLEGIDGCGFNCGVGCGHMYQLLCRVVFPDNKYIYAAPNAGYPEQMQNRMVFMDNEAYFAKNMKKIANLKIDLLGGCCGTTPEYIKAMVTSIDINQLNSERKNTVVTVEKAMTVINNDFMELLHSGKKVIAVELDPPYDAKIGHIMECAHSLQSNKVDILTFADSPMGRSRVDSILMSIKIAEDTGLKVMPHVCCRDKNMISMRASLLGAYIHGIRNLLVVTGDPVPGESRVSTTGVFDYNSVRLMEYIKEMNVEHFADNPITYGGALNYGRGPLEKVVDQMKKKIDAGAQYFLTQPVFSKEDVKKIQQIKTMVDTKILCGIMPLVSYRNANFIKNEITGIHVPEEIVNRYHPDMTREAAELVGASIAREIMELLNPVADGYYVMLPFNRVSLIDKIL